uniref:RING-type E3 ubiquitin transferase n=1 Tax=Neolamprologus brichardi TaxID=32507 RepID=A0A3Q4MUL2_NEOBR
MTGTEQKGKGKPICYTMMDDRQAMLHILEEPQMRREGERLRTFHNWPADAPVTSGDLAKTGFFFLGPGDKVQCFCCGGILRCWVQGDSPATEHKRHFPACNFILGRAVGNIPLQADSSDSVDGQLLSQLQRMTMDDQGTAGQAVYPEMEAEDSRLTTFHNWPTEASIQPDVLARAGFFYTGHGDNVKCFYCDGGLRNWEPDLVGGLGASSAMLSPVVQTVLQMGFEASLVESLVQTKYLLTGQHYTSVSDLVTDVLQAEEEDRQRRPRSRGSCHFKENSPEELLRQLQEERTCKVCMDKLVSIVFIPCGHLVVCGDCAASLRHCPICRAVIRGSVRAFMS